MPANQQTASVAAAAANANKRPKMAYEIMFLVSSLGLALLVFAFVCYLKCCSSNAGGGGGGEWGYFADDPARYVR